MEQAKHNSEENSDNSALERIKSKQKDYKLRAYIWQFLHYLLGGVSVTLAAVLAAKAVPSWTSTEEIAALVAVTASLSTFLRPDARAKKYNAARSILRTARNAYEYDGHPLVKALNDADELTSNE